MRLEYCLKLSHACMGAIARSIHAADHGSRSGLATLLSEQNWLHISPAAGLCQCTCMVSSWCTITVATDIRYGQQLRRYVDENECDVDLLTVNRDKILSDGDTFYIAEMDCSTGQ